MFTFAFFWHKLFCCGEATAVQGTGEAEATGAALDGCEKQGEEVLW